MNMPSILLTQNFSGTVFKMVHPSPPRSLLFLTVNRTEKKQERGDTSDCTGVFLKFIQSKAQTKMQAQLQCVHSAFVTICITVWCVFAASWTLIVIFFPPIRFSVLLKWKTNSGFFQAFWGQTFLCKSQSRKRPFSLSCSLPEIQTSSQETMSHPICSASVFALEQEISASFQLYKNL